MDALRLSGMAIQVRKCVMLALPKEAKILVSDFIMALVEILRAPFINNRVLDLTPEPAAAAGIANIQHLEAEPLEAV
jgi:hypothetical protein